MSAGNGSLREERLLVIDQAIRGLAIPSYRAIIEELQRAGFSACKRTVQRDIMYMQREYQAPEIVSRRCVFEGEEGATVEYGHFYADTGWKLNVDKITERDIEAVRLARHLLSAYEGHPALQDLESAYENMMVSAGAEVQQHFESGTNPIHFAPLVKQKIRPDVWRNVVEAAKRRVSIRMEYDKASAWSKKGQKSRLVDPYYVVNLGGIWYLIGTAGLQDTSVRQYDMARIVSAKITSSAFRIPRDFDIENILAVTFGRFVGDPNDLVTVKVRFSQDVVPLVRDSMFHRQEQRQMDKQGRLTLSFPVTPSGATPRWRYYHVRSWILSWGPDCEVLEPAELKELVRSDVEAMLKKT